MMRVIKNKLTENYDNNKHVDNTVQDLHHITWEWGHMVKNFERNLQIVVADNEISNHNQ